mmetsp:Transcript_59007/g.140909  ORF Transcript_59007/g.140909 Transcript_59007/m.140909 type:complete len:267 (-) Transcript_59007:1434-2234(-)
MRGISSCLPEETSGNGSGVPGGFLDTSCKLFWALTAKGTCLGALFLGWSWREPRGELAFPHVSRFLQARFSLRAASIHGASKCLEMGSAGELGPAFTDVDGVLGIELCERNVAILARAVSTRQLLAVDVAILSKLSNPSLPQPTRGPSNSFRKSSKVRPRSFTCSCTSSKCGPTRSLSELKISSALSTPSLFTSNRSKISRTSASPRVMFPDKHAARKAVYEIISPSSTSCRACSSSLASSSVADFLNCSVSALYVMQPVPSTSKA